MKKQRFKIGQAIAPKMGVDWYGPGIRVSNVEVYHVLSYHHPSEVKFFDGDPHINCWYIQLCEVPGTGYAEEYFDPVISTHELQSLLSEVPQTETETV